MSNINDKIRQIAKETEPELIHIRRELHQYPELGIFQRHTRSSAVSYIKFRALR